MQMYFDTFPDLKWEITNLFAKGNQVVLEGEGLGTRSDNPKDGGPPGSRVQFTSRSWTKSAMARFTTSRRISVGVSSTPMSEWSVPGGAGRFSGRGLSAW